jgi:hypothetical protein
MHASLFIWTYEGQDASYENRVLHVGCTLSVIDYDIIYLGGSCHAKLLRRKNRVISPEIYIAQSANQV